MLQNFNKDSKTCLECTSSSEQSKVHNNNVFQCLECKQNLDKSKYSKNMIQNFNRDNKKCLECVVKLKEQQFRNKTFKCTNCDQDKPADQ
eukprot:CAMPEP_0116995270 /NCGR_PEP_ID=MMETSP0467-20121206/68652_1 /TAXON_ID=283647 /ORGANISM="Mesodinium pulex, Strain SPMC105" /LENGTH=89 /DNA_ID=CAMNT_0004693549 /DNA_START=712 /DNA_END=981 /DNA_ORIENTATION=+